VDVYAGILSELKDSLVCSLKLMADIIKSGIRKFVCDGDRPVFLKRKLVGHDMDQSSQSHR
jgi:hypothetical protein